MKLKHRVPVPERSRPARMEPMAEGLPRTSRRREWSRMTDEELYIFAKEFIRVNGITGRKQFEKADTGLYVAIVKRNLMDRLGVEKLRRETREWVSMGDDEIITIAKKFIRENRIAGKTKLNRSDPGLYTALRKRGLLEELRLGNLRREMRGWASMGSKELVAFAKEFILERGVGGRAELAEADKGLYSALMRRKLLDDIGLMDMRGERRDWASMSNEEMIAHARVIIEKNGITGRSELDNADPSFYGTLRLRGLLEGLGIGNRKEKDRKWAVMSNEEMVADAKEFIIKNGIGRRKDLHAADQGRYQALRARKLLDDVFSDIESSGYKDAVNGVIDALDSFGDDG